MPSQPSLGAACLLAAISCSPAYAQPQWQLLPQNQTKAGNQALASQPASPQWQLLPAPAPGSGPAPVIWQPVAPGEQQALPPPTGQTAPRQVPRRQPPHQPARGPIPAAHVAPLLGRLSASTAAGDAAHGERAREQRFPDHHWPGVALLHRPSRRHKTKQCCNRPTMSHPSAPDMPRGCGALLASRAT